MGTLEHYHGFFSMHTHAQRMPNKPYPGTPAQGSLIAQRLAGASFHDTWCVPSMDAQQSALGHFIGAATSTPGWIEACMKARNRVGKMVGLKDLGTLSAIDPDKPAKDYRRGDRMGIFTMLENTFDEALFGDSDTHLNVVLSLHRQPHPDDGQGVLIRLTTVVHVKNWLGHLYMLPVAPMHKLITPAVLANIA